MKPCLPLLLRALLLSACGAIAVTAGTFTVFGPEDITANQVPATRTFAVTNPSANWMIRIDNGGRNGQYQKISSGSIEVNGIEVAGNSDFNQNVMLIQGAVSLQANNTLVVDFNGVSSRGLTVEVFLVDETPPTITSMVAPSPNAAGWNNTGVTVSFNCQDTDTGITFCTDPVTIGALGTTNVLGLAQDGVFNTAETSVAVSIDTLDPISTTVLNPGPNEAGWNNTDVTVTFQAQDAISGIASVTPPVVVTVEGAAQVVNGSATDVAGNTANASASVSLDKTLPQLAIADPPDGTTVLVSVLQISGTVSDALSGLASVQCDGEDAQLVSAGDFTCDVSLEPDGNAIDVVAVDAAGNTATQTLNITFAAPPALTTYSPLNFTTVAAGPATITGTASPDTSQVLINGVPATLSGGGFSAVVPLHTGSNTIVATGSNAAGNSGMATVHVTLDDGAPFVSIDSLLDGAIVSSTTIVVGGQVGDPVGPTDGSNNVTVSVNGVAATVGGGRYVAEGVALSPGLNTLAAQAFDGVGNTSTFSISVNFQDPTGSPRITTVSGDMQQATIGEALADPLVAAVFNALGSPVANVPVVFRITRGSGTLVDNGTPARMVTALTNAQGRASANLTLGTRAGEGSNAVEATAAGYQRKAAFVAAGLPDLSHHLHHDDGDNQVGIVGQPLPFPLVVAATDSGHNRLPNVPITFTVQSGGGNFGGQPSVTVMTDPEGFARATFTLGPTPGISDHVVTADTIGNAGSVITFSASAKVSGDPADTSVSGVVLDNTNIPVPGVTVSIDGTALTTQTTAQGRFFLQPAPVGAFHLHVDGTTATRPGAWASLAFEMVTIPGVDNDLGMPIHILPIDTSNSVYVSPTEGGTVTLAAIPGFALEVFPGSATFPGGSNEGDISVTVVHADKVPMTPNFGQQPRLVITVQPPGVILDPPAKVTYPNLDGEAPGEIVEFYSFDHDMERFVGVGSGVVSEDGLTITSDPGVGITKTGWFCGGNPPSSAQCQNIGVTLSKIDIVLRPGEETTLSATGSPNSIGNPAYSWSSADVNIASVEFAQGNDSQIHPDNTVKLTAGETLANTQIVVSFLAQSGQLASTQANVSVIELDITIHDGQNGAPVPDDDEESKGAVTVANLNDSDSDGQADDTDADGVPGEKDLLKLTIDQPEAGSEEPVQLTVVSGDVKFWDSSTKGAEITDLRFPADELPKDLWIEALVPSVQLRDIEIQADYRGQTDTVKATAVWVEKAQVLLTRSPTVQIPSDLDSSQLRGLIESRRAQDGSLFGFGPFNAQTAGSDDRYGGRILYEWQIVPPGADSLGVRFDVARQIAQRAFVILEGDGLISDPNVLDFPADDELPNDDSVATDEDLNPTNNHIYSWDAPSVDLDPGSPGRYAYKILRFAAKEWVRVSFGVSFPSGGNVEFGTRASHKADWNTMVYIRRGDGGVFVEDSAVLSSSAPSVEGAGDGQVTVALLANPVTEGYEGLFDPPQMWSMSGTEGGMASNSRPESPPPAGSVWTLSVPNRLVVSAVQGQTPFTEGDSEFLFSTLRSSFKANRIIEGGANVAVGP